MNQSTFNSSVEDELIETEIEITPSECFISKDHALHSKIENFLFGMLPAGYHPTLKASIFSGFDMAVRIYQLTHDKSYLMKFQETQKFLTPLEIKIYLAEFHNRNLQNQPKTKGPGIRSLNFISELNADPRLINKKILEALTPEKLTEISNQANQIESKLMVEMSLEEYREHMELTEARLRLQRDFFASYKIKELNKVTLKQNEAYAQERLNRAEGVKTTKSGKVLRTNELTPLKKLIKELTSKYGESKVSYWTKIVKLDLMKMTNDQIETSSKRYDLMKSEGLI